MEMITPMAPRKIALLTDSTADLTTQVAEENHIHVVPLRIRCADGEYSDGVDIHAADIYTRLRAGELPKTSLPAGEDITAAFDRIRDEGYDGVIAVMLSGGLSGTYNMTRLLAEERLAIVLGTEGDGLAQATIDACDYTVRIPMAHGVDSLNVAAASAVAFWQLGRR